MEMMYGDVFGDEFCGKMLKSSSYYFLNIWINDSGSLQKR
jgi:hypothetical protein